MHCDTCVNGSYIEIKMQVNGSELTFRRCGTCEAQRWDDVDGDVLLDEVLELARTR
jgi:hypothetical protein